MKPPGGRVACTAEYPSDLLDWARRYSARSGVRLRVILTAALAEYAARRDQRAEVGPAPQLHFKRGHPPRGVAELRSRLLEGSSRGRRVRFSE